MARIWKTPLFVLATAYFVLDGLFSYVTRPLVAWLGRMRIFERMQRWIVSLRPYPSLALFALPVVILEPVKPLAGYFVATGHLVTGAMTFVTGEVLKLTCVERLFELNRKKAPVNSRVCRRIQAVAANDGPGRIAGGLESVAAARKPCGSDRAAALASIEARPRI